jgi:hypothetical protein
VLTEDRSNNLPPTLSRSRVNLGGLQVESLHVKNFIPDNALLFHRLVLEGCRVDPHLESLEDWDFLLSVCQKAMPQHYDGGGAITDARAQAQRQQLMQSVGLNLPVAWF